MEDIKCPSCEAVNPNDAYLCESCGSTLVIGKLTSLGTGVLPKGFVFEMRAKDLALGRHVSNEFVIPSNLIARRQMRFGLRSYGFSVEDLEGHNRCYIDDERLDSESPLRDGVTLKVGVEEFLYNYIPPTGERVTKVVDPLASHLQLMLGIISEFHTSLNLQDVFDNAVDAILRITGTKRGYAFLLDDSGGGVEMEEVSARGPGGKPLVEDADEGYTISQSIIKRVVEGDDSIIIEDAGAQQVETETIRRFKLKSLICLPLLTYNYRSGKRSVMGVLYADSIMPTGSLPKHCRPTLQMLAQILTSTIVKWQNYDKMEKHFQILERNVSSLESDLELVGEEMDLVIRELTDASGSKIVSSEATVAELQAVRSRIEAAQRMAERLQFVRRGMADPS